MESNSGTNCDNMELKFSKIVGRERKEAEMLLYGDLGEKPGMVNGHYFAQELNYLGRNYDQVKVRLNCGGGLISHGLSVFSEMVTSPAYIIVQVDGIAASMGAVLIAAADRALALDYARIMLHSPYFLDENGAVAKGLTAKDKKAIAILRDQLLAMLAKRGIDAEAAKTMLGKGDTWYNAEEAVAAKLIDEVVQTGKVKQFEGLEITDMAALLQETINPKNSDMKQLIAKFQLPDTATEVEIMTAVNALEQGHQAALAKAKADKDKFVDKLIAVAKIAGTVDDTNEASYRRLADTDPELFTNIVSIKKDDLQGDEKTRLSDVIAQLTKLAEGKAPVDADTKDWDFYQRNDPQALARMETTEPERFKKLKSEYEAKFV